MPCALLGRRCPKKKSIIKVKYVTAAEVDEEGKEDSSQNKTSSVEHDYLIVLDDVCDLWTKTQMTSWHLAAECGDVITQQEDDLTITFSGIIIIL